jgi:hypothetical protein
MNAYLQFNWISSYITFIISTTLAVYSQGISGDHLQLIVVHDA